MRTKSTTDLSAVMIAPERIEEAVEVELRMIRGILVLLAVLAVQMILLGVLILLAVTGILPIDEEVIVRTWGEITPRPFGYW